MSRTSPAGGFAYRLGLALANPRFQIVLLAVAGTPLLAFYLVRLLAWPLVSGDVTSNDFLDVNLASAAALHAGRDPFGSCAGPSCFQAGGVNPYPPFVAWALQPLLGLGPAVANRLALVACHACLVAFLVLVLRRLDCRTWRFRALLVIASIGWWPVVNDLLERQLQFVVLLGVGVWISAAMARRPVLAGAAIGVVAAVKLLVAPLLGFAVLLRQGRLALAGLAVWAGLWALAPAYLPDYLLHVLPSLTGGTGIARNDAPVGVIARLLDPPSMYGQTAPGSLAVDALAAGVAAAVLVATLLAIVRTPHADPRIGIALLTAGLPMLTSLAWPGHLVILLAPMFILLDHAVRNRSPRLWAAVAASWILIGPIQVVLIQLSVRGSTPEPVLQVLSDAGFAGIAILWAACLAALLHSHDRGRERRLAT